jgi:hypothetical protein
MDSPQVGSQLGLKELPPECDLNMGTLLNGCVCVMHYLYYNVLIRSQLCVKYSLNLIVLNESGSSRSSRN